MKTALTIFAFVLAVGICFHSAKPSGKDQLLSVRSSAKFGKETIG